MHQHELKIKKHKKVSHYTYGRYGSTTTIELRKYIKRTRASLPCFFDWNWFGGIALALMSL